MRRTRNIDGTIHFSDLKHFSRSPAHYLEAVNSEVIPTLPMRIGTCAHYHTLGKRHGRELVVFDGDRRGNGWKDFKAEHADAEIMSRDEWDLGARIADAVRADPVAREILESSGMLFELPLKWKDGEIPRSTRGIDMLSPQVLGELKTTTNTEPDKLQAHALKQQWNAQLVDYRRGVLSALEHVPARICVIAVEVKAPFAVTVLDLEADVLEAGEKSITSWLEDFRRCEDNDDWPAYVRAPVKWALPDWVTGEIEFDDEDEEAA